MAEDVSKEGTIATLLQHEHPDWTTNRDTYNFPEMVTGQITFRATKNPDRTISVVINGPFGNQYDFREAIPECDARGLHVAVTWGKGEVILYLNGKKAKTRKSPRTVH